MTMNDTDTLKEDLAHTEDEMQLLLDELAKRWPEVEIEINVFRSPAMTIGSETSPGWELRLSAEITSRRTRPRG